MAVGATLGLVLATQLDPERAARFTGWLVAAGALAGAVHSFVRLPDAPVCRIPRWLGGCGGEATIRDTDGNSRPRRPCWGHPGGKPQRVVNLVVLTLAYGVPVAVLLVVAMSRG
jgi:hypothetical protein